MTRPTMFVAAGGIAGLLFSTPIILLLTVLIAVLGFYTYKSAKKAGSEHFVGPIYAIGSLFFIVPMWVTSLIVQLLITPAIINTVH